MEPEKRLQVTSPVWLFSHDERIGETSDFVFQESVDLVFGWRNIIYFFANKNLSIRKLANVEQRGEGLGR